VLGRDLVLHVDARHPGVLVPLDAPVDVGDGLAHLVGVDDEGDRDHLRDPVGLLDHLGGGEHPVVGDGVVHHRGGVAAHVAGGEPDLFDDPGGERAVAVGGDERPPGDE
jgi:hypothetical protein